jgi:iron complex outermembrane receptor protein
MKILRLCCSLTAALFSIAFPSFTQESDKDTMTTYYMGEILVTGRRGGGEVLQLPMAVSVVVARDLMANRGTGLNDALWAVPGVLAQSRAGSQDVRLTVRGFGARGNGDRSNAGTIRGIKLLIDGIPETDPDGRTSLDLVDLQSAARIEVVRTNASTLFGNASGGVINIESQSPFSTPYLELNSTIGSFGLRRHNLKVGALMASGRFSLSASTVNFDGWREQTSSSGTQLHASFVSELDASTRLKLFASGAVNRFEIPGGLTQSQYDADAKQANSTYAARNERRYNRVGRLGFSLSKALNDEHSFEIIGYVTPKVLQRSERGTFRDFNRYHLGGGVVHQWKPADIPWLARVTGGVDEAYQDGAILFYNLVNGERGDSLRTNKREGANTLGAFVQAEARLLDNLSATIGGRYDRQSYLSEIFAAGAKQKSTYDQLTLDHFTPKVALLYRLTSNHSVYLSIGGGVEAPAFNEVDPPPTLVGVQVNPFLKPMSSTTIELGVKGFELFRNHTLLRSLLYSLAAYSISIKNEIVPYGDGVWFFSAGESRRNGFELGAQVDLRYGFSLKAAFTYLDAEYIAYTNELGDFAGRKVPGIPPTVLNARLRYASTIGLDAELGLEHVGSYYADDGNSARVPSYLIFNGTAMYTLRAGILNALAFVGVNNLADLHYASSAFTNPVTRTSSGAPIAPSYLEPGLPRNIFGGLDLRIDL